MRFRDTRAGAQEPGGFPIRDDKPTFLPPIVTVGLIVASVRAWLFAQGVGTEPALTKSVCLLGLTPGELLNTLPPGTRVPLGQGLYCVLSDSSSAHTLLTSMFMHGGWLHLIGNLWFLWIFGNNVEDSMGHVRFAVFYVLCGLLAAAARVAANPASPVPMMGASGAIGGVMGAYIVLYPKVRVHLLIILGFCFTTFAVPAVAMLGYWLLLQLLGGLVSVGAPGGGTAFWAHIGGFAAGAVLVLFFRKPELVRRHPHYGWRPRAERQSAWERLR